MFRGYIGNRDFYKRVLAVSVPIMLQNGVTNFVNMLDNIMVGRIGTVEMTGVAVANQLLFVFMLCIFGAVSGAGIFGTQFYGKGDAAGMRYAFRFKLLLCMGLAVCGIAVFSFGERFLIMRFLQGEGNAEEIAASYESARTYLYIMLIGLIPYALAQCYSSSLRETGETMVPMLAGVAAVCVNLALNYLLIFEHGGHFGYGEAGAAIATVVSRFAELFIVVVWCHRHKEKAPFIIRAAKHLFHVPVLLCKKMIAGGLPLMLNETLWAVGMAMLNQRYSVRGYDVVSATNISSTFWNLFTVVSMAIGTSVGILVGQLLGRGEFEKAKEEDRKLITFAVFVSVLTAVVYFFCAPVIPKFYNTTGNIRSIATGLMQVSAFVMPLDAFVHASYFTIRSGGKTFVTFLFDSCFALCVSVPAAFILTECTDLPILPVYAVVQGLTFIKCVIGYILLKKGVWVRNIVDDAKEALKA